MALSLSQESRESTKIRTVVSELGKLKEKMEATSVMEKAVIVSQWTSMLEIIKSHVIKMGMKCSEINGETNIFFYYYSKLDIVFFLL